MRSGVPIVMAPLDLTHRVLTTPERLDAFAALGNRAGTAVAGLLGFSERFDLAKYGVDRRAAARSRPSSPGCSGRTSSRASRSTSPIETTSELTLGMTVADWWQITDRPRNVHFLRDGDADGFFALLTERLARLP